MSAADPVAAFLRDRGLANEVVDSGAAGLIDRWEQAARDLEHAVYPFHIEDWLDELDGRQLLDELTNAVPQALTPALSARLNEADVRMRAGTEIEAFCLWGDVLAKRLRWKADREWWYWRRPARIGDDFAGERTE